MKAPNKLKQEVVALIAPRIADELSAYYQYLSMSNWARGVGHFKAAEYFLKESQNEQEHAKKIIDYLVDWNVPVTLPELDKPKASFTNLAECIEVYYDIEYELYETYNDTCSDLMKEDLAAYEFLSGYLSIQTESVAEVSDMKNMLQGVDVNSKFEMLMLEDKLFS